MHIEIQVALNFVISYLYNKLPRRRVNIFGEELEKALRDKFQGHWYPDKPFKGSAYRCLKTGDPIDSVLERAARESGVPIDDILENLPNELSVWVDPGEVSFRIGEKGAVKILYTENNENHEDNSSADREVTKTFNPEAQCFRPIDAVSTTLNNLSLSPKALPPQVSGSSPHSATSTSPTYKGSPNPSGQASISVSSNNSAAFSQRAAQAPLTFTTATFAQTKFGSTKLKTSSKRNNSSSYRMSPTEFSNYIKQRAMQQQLHHGHGPVTSSAFGPLGAVSPARSLSPNPLSLGMGQPNVGVGQATTDAFYYPSIAMGLFPQYNGQRNMFDSHFNSDASTSAASANLGLFGTSVPAATTGSQGSNKFSTYLEPCFFANGANVVANAAGQPQQVVGSIERSNSSESSSFGLDGIDGGISNAIGSGEEMVSMESAASVISVGAPRLSSPECSLIAAPSTSMPTLTAATGGASQDNSVANIVTATAAPTVSSSTTNSTTASAASTSNSKLIDGLNSFYGNGSSYQQLLVAN